MSEFIVERLAYPKLKPEETSLRVPEVEEGLYKENLEIINRSFRIIEDPSTGKRFEIATAGAPHDRTQTVDCESSTYRSSLSNNVGNAVEFAENASLHPERTRLYISSLGNGGSSYFDKNERRHLRETGRFTHEKPNGQPEALPTIQALAGALKANDLKIGRISANSAGGPLATALSLELPEDQLTHIHLKGQPNISERGLIRDMFFGMFIVENMINNPKNEKASQDPWKMSYQLKEEAETLLGNIHNVDEKEIALTGLSYLTKLYTDTKAYSRGAASMKDIMVDRGSPIGPAVFDTRNMLARHPKLKTTFHFTKQDKLYRSFKNDEFHQFGDIERFLRHLRWSLHDKFAQDTEAILHDGTHADHTHYPSRRWAVENYAFKR